MMNALKKQLPHRRVLMRGGYPIASTGLRILLCSILLGTGTPHLRADPTDTSQPPVAENGSGQPTPLPTDNQASAQATPQAPAMSPEELDTLVAPIALYPDPLISQILVASTYPLELVQASQWLQQHPQLQGQDLKDGAAAQSWDASIQALVLFPDVIKRLNADITWTTNLGNAFLANQGSVMDAIQRMRVKAEEAGKLKSTPQETVTTAQQSGQQVVEIQPADPEVIYVPQYNPVWIWGPPAYYYYPAWYYPPPPPFGFWFFWGAPWRASFYFGPGWGGWGWWGWHCGWGSRSIVVNRTFIVNNHFNSVNVTNVNVHNVHVNNVWVHNPEHRLGVSYPNQQVAQRFRNPNPAGVSRFGVNRNPPPSSGFNRAAGSAPRTFTHPTVSQVQQQFHQRALMPRPTTGAGFRSTGPAERMGNRVIAPSVYRQNHNAFAGTEHGAYDRTYSNRGRASLGRVSPTNLKKSGNYYRGGGKDTGFGGGRGGGRL
jgi:hypothetical protein